MRSRLYRFLSCHIPKPLLSRGSFLKKEPPCTTSRKSYIDSGTGLAVRFVQLAAGVTLAALSGCGPMPGGSRPTQQGIPTRAEARTALIYEANLHQGPETLRAFLSDFPKGADLHVHLSGAVYAETLIRDAGEDGLCVDKTTLSFAKPPCRGNLIPATQLSGNIDRQSQLLYDKLID